MVSNIKINCFMIDLTLTPEMSDSKNPKQAYKIFSLTYEYGHKETFKVVSYKL